MSWAALVLAGSGQVSGASGEAIPGCPKAPPASHVLDDAGIFRHDPEVLQRISSRLVDFEKRRGIPIYLAVFPGLIGTDPARRATDLHRMWLGDRYGFVLVFDSDTGELGLGRSIEFEDADEAECPGRTARIPTYELLSIMLRINERMKPREDRVDYLDRLVGQVVGEFDASLDRLEAPLSRGERLRFVLIVIGLIAALGLMALFFSRWLSIAEKKAGRRYRFPVVLVGRRLGAPYGGGRVSSRSFRAISGGADSESEPRGGAGE